MIFKLECCWLHFMQFILLANVVLQSDAKLVEGRLKTLDDWAFLSRFCFISGRGRFEYLIEFERRYGEPQLLLYYDDVSQWPSVYKTPTTCQQKVSVLGNHDNQIVTLAARVPHNYYSGCTLQTRYPDSKPSLPISTPPPHGGIGGADTVTSFYDQYLDNGSSTTATPNPMFPMSSTTAMDFDDGDNSTSMDMLLDDLGADVNDTEVFNASRVADGLRHGGSATTFENRLENDTAFQMDVEQLFERDIDADSGAPDGGSVPDRVRRSLPAPSPFRREGVGTVLITCTNIGGFTSSRERWWYIAIANCGSRKGLDLKYKFRLTNGPRGDFWHEHFSADEMYILPIYLVECLLYSFLLVAIFICTIELRTLHLLHCTYRLYAVSVIMQWIGVLLQGIAYSTYGITGLLPQTLSGMMFMGASEVTFLILLLLLAKGYTITRARLSSMSAIKLTVFVNVYIVVFVSLFVFQAETFDPGEVLNLYESPAGIALASLRLGAWAAFCVSTVNTFKKSPEKSGFYMPFGVLGSLWIMGGPMTTVFGVTLLDPWVRESIICLVQASIAFGGHAAFLYLTWPSRANKSFPYHVRTNHVGIASTDDDGADYPRHTYEPALPDPNTIIPLSRRTEELLSNAYNSYLVERIDGTQSLNNEPPNSDGRRVPAHLSPRRPSYHPRESTAPPPAQLYADVNQQQPQANGQHQQDDDSGHPSLETSTSISPNETNAAPSAQHSPVDRQTASRSDESTGVMPPVVVAALATSTFNGHNRPNPFIVNGKAPNKIILEPIELTYAGSSGGNSAHSGRVPRHLFAAKNPPRLS